MNIQQRISAFFFFLLDIQMATVGNANNSSYLNTSRLSYISVAEFSNNIFTYKTTTANFNTTGTMTSFATQGLSAPKGHVLRENGRKYIPGANPAAPGFNTYMVGVYDNQTMQSGFIDPNGPQFAIYNTDKPNFLPDGVDPVGGLTDHGAPVYTNSTVQAIGNITTDTGNFIATAGGLVVSTKASTVSAGGAFAGTVSLTAGTVTVSTTAVKSTSVVVATYNQSGIGACGILNVSAITNGSFTIQSVYPTGTYSSVPGGTINIPSGGGSGTIPAGTPYAAGAVNTSDGSRINWFVIG